MGSMDGKVALITGAGAGMGVATARLFGEAGAKVVCADLVLGNAQDTAAAIEEAGGTALAVEADVSDPISVQQLTEQTISAYGGVDAVVNNAGVTLFRPLTETTDEDWDRVLGVNLKAAFLLSRAVVPIMRERDGGSIVNIASTNGVQGMRDHVAYCASKGGVVNLTRALALELAPVGVRVNCVCPGGIDTGMFAEATGGDEAVLERVVATIPAGRIGQPAEVGSASLFLCSAEASYINGAVIVVDGGFSSGPFSKAEA